METKNWWDNLSDEQITMLKLNKLPLCYSPKPIIDSFGLIPSEDLEMLNLIGNWRKCVFSGLSGGACYRLRPDWTRPGRQVEYAPYGAKEIWDGADPAKKNGHWEYCEIEVRHYKTCGYETSEYCFERENTGFKLYEAFSMVGFGGIEFEEDPGNWFYYLVAKRNILALCTADEKDKPGTPSGVRFWVQE